MMAYGLYWLNIKFILFFKITEVKMAKTIEVTLEVFGKRRLSREFNSNELSGRSVGNIIDHMVSQPWSGDDARTLVVIKREMASSGGYVPQVAVGKPNLPVKDRKSVV